MTRPERWAWSARPRVWPKAGTRCWAMQHHGQRSAGYGWLSQSGRLPKAALGFGTGAKVTERNRAEFRYKTLDPQNVSGQARRMRKKRFLKGRNRWQIKDQAGGCMGKPKVKRSSTVSTARSIPDPARNRWADGDAGGEHRTSFPEGFPRQKWGNPSPGCGLGGPGLTKGQTLILS